MKISQAIIKEELEIFEDKFRDSVRSNVLLLDRIMSFIVKRKGKQLRPMFVLLTAKLCGTINESTYRAASLVELLHTATLVHDDVVDESMERRGFFSTYALWKAKVSVLVGDYLLAKGLLLSLDNSDFRILQIMSEAVRLMSEIYFEIIKNKTASLLASACAAGAYSSTQNEQSAERMRSFGENVGIAFQIKDDLFDYGNEDIGKPTGNDIQEKKMTLPLIYTLNKVDSSTKRKLIYIIKNENKDKQKVKQVIHEVVKAGGIHYATEKMFHYRDEALKELFEFPDSEVRQGLEELVRFTTDRKY